MIYKDVIYKINPANNIHYFETSFISTLAFLGLYCPIRVVFKVFHTHSPFIEAWLQDAIKQIQLLYTYSRTIKILCFPFIVEGIE